MLKERILHGIWKMENGKVPGLSGLFHFPSSIFHPGRHISEAW
jgi:hypothetical protein